MYKPRTKKLIQEEISIKYYNNNDIRQNNRSCLYFLGERKELDHLELLFIIYQEYIYYTLNNKKITALRKNHFDR